MNKKRVWCLYRVSTMGQVTKDEQNDRVDIPMQRNECHKFTLTHPDWEITNELSELGVSGFKTSLDQREKLIEIKQAAADKKFDVLLVFMFDRIGRRTYETPLVVKYLIDNGIEVWSVKEGQRKMETNVDELMCIIDSWVANNESRKTSVRISAGKSVLAELGYYSGGYLAFGQNAEHLGRANKKGHPVRDFVVNVEEALVLESIFHAIVDEGLGGHSIAKRLNDKGITSKTGNAWRASTIRSLVANPVCLGYVKSKGILYGPFSHLQTVDQYYYDKANEIMQARAPKNKSTYNGPLKSDNNEALLKSLVFCGHCGGRMNIGTQTRKKKLADGTVKAYPYVHYRCYKRLVSSAHEGRTHYEAKRIENDVLRVVRNFFALVKTLPKKEMLKAAAEREGTLAAATCKHAEDKLKKAESDLAKLKEEAIKSITGEGKLSIDVINSLIVKQEDTASAARLEYEQAKQRLDEEEKNAEFQEVKIELLQSWADTFDSASIEHRRMIIASIVDKIIVSGDYELEISLKLDAQQYLALAS